MYQSGIRSQFFPTFLHHCLSLSFSPSISIFFDFFPLLLGIYAYEMTISRHIQWHDMFSFQPSFIVNQRWLWIKSEGTCENKNARDSRDKGSVKETESEREKWRRWDYISIWIEFFQRKCDTISVTWFLFSLSSFVSSLLFLFIFWHFTLESQLRVFACTTSVSDRSRSRIDFCARVECGMNAFFRRKKMISCTLFRFVVIDAAATQMAERYNCSWNFVPMFFLSLFVCLLVKHSKIASKISVALSL